MKRNYGKQSEDLEKLDFTDVLKEADTFFPATRKAIVISLSQPCTTSNIERSFSTLRRVKTWLRSTMTENRLNGLCMLSVHRKIRLYVLFTLSFSVNMRATFKGLNKYGTCFASQSSRPPPRWPSHGHLEYGIPIRGRLEDGRYPRLLF
ncbi:hypothetical protein NQ318_011178 [Aromia moschata]|uniref:HAT C-terminal dimerisation domain-containing protein n=1 Tax=Aromia moschata TaxID=1265417 RepID=A0AAV8YHX2_9CUCU|nr:hypothetical protein NQ318_011178 [Aromia moschata]